MPRPTSLLGVALAVTLPMGLLALAPVARAADTGAEAEILGLIVQKSSPWVSTRSLEATMDRAGADVSGGSAALGATVAVIDFAEPLTPAEAEPIAAALEARSDVRAVEPNARVRALASPVIPNDPSFGLQWDMWDGGGEYDFGTRAADIWGLTRGAPEVVVGIIDTGGTEHPDLAGTTVPGFDFITDAADARDGNAWDPDPADEGDWCLEDNTRSDWHGTHVAGTVNAVQDNGIGISGLAPEVKVQHLRVLGACGGTTFDILSAVLWGAGEDLGAWWGISLAVDPGINPTPASVLNLSLGGDSSCGSVSQQVFARAKARGVTVIAAAGNETAPVSSSWPANCADVVSVGSGTEGGYFSNFSNYGTAPGQLTISAPGGSIYSTANTGITVPSAPGYKTLNGTSMAAPHVSAAAALLYSMGVVQPSAVVSALTSSVRPFASGANCDVVRCGAGLLDVSKLAAYAPTGDPGAPTAVTVTPGDGSALVRWTAPQETGGADLVSATAVATPGGASCTTASTACEITGLTNGTAYTVAVTVTNAAGRTGPAGISAPFTPTAVSVPGVVSGFSKGRYAGTSPSLRVTVRWQPPVDDGGSPVLRYRVRYGTGDRWKAWTSVESTSLRLTGLRAGKRYVVQVRAVNAAGAGPKASASFTTPRR